MSGALGLRPPKKPSATQVQAITPELREAYGTCRLDEQKWAKPYKTSQAAPGAFHSHYEFQTEAKGGTLSISRSKCLVFFHTSRHPIMQPPEVIRRCLSTCLEIPNICLAKGLLRRHSYSQQTVEHYGK